MSSAALEVSVSVAAHFRLDGKERETESRAQILCRAWSKMPHHGRCPEAALVPSMRLTFVHPLAGPSGRSRFPERGVVYEREASQKKIRSSLLPLGK